MKETIVAGARIKGASISDALAVSTLSAQDIETLGVESGVDLLENLPEQGLRCARRRTIAKASGLLDALDERGATLRLMLDSHAAKATATHLFYSQRHQDGEATAYCFAVRRLAPARAASTSANTAFEHRATRSRQRNAKNYLFARYGIPSITFETGDESDPAPIFADAMMETLLAAKCGSREDANRVVDAADFAGASATHPPHARIDMRRKPAPPARRNWRTWRRCGCRRAS